MSLTTLAEMIAVDRMLIDTNRELQEKMTVWHDYTTHRQWQDDAIRQLDLEGRSALEIDMISPKLNTFSGVERNFRTGLEAKPTEGRDEDQAKIATAVLQFQNRGRRLDKVNSRAFKTAGIDGLSWIDVHVRMGDDFLAEIVVNWESGFKVRLDAQTLDPELKDTTYLEREKWMTVDHINTFWPNAGLQDVPVTATDMEMERRFTTETDDYVHTVPMDWKYMIDSKRQKRRVVEIQERRYTNKSYILLPGGMLMPVDNFFDYPQNRTMWRLVSMRAGRKIKISSTNDIFEMMRAAGQKDMSLVSRPEQEIWSMQFTGGKILEEPKRQPYIHNNFSLIPVFAFLGETDDGRLRSLGIVEALIGVQDEKNKRRSQFLDILNRAPKGGGWYNQQKGMDRADMAKIQKPGEWVGVNGDPTDLVYERQQRYMPILEHYKDAERMAETDATQISGINEPLQGIASNAKESGFAAQTRIKQAMLGMAEPLENMDTAKTEEGRQMLTLMQQYWTPQKLMRVINTEELNVRPEAVQAFLSNFKTTNYDINIEQGKHSSTMRDWMRHELVELMQFGVPPMVLLPAIIKLSDYPDKDQIMQGLMAVQMQQQLAGNSPSGPPARG